MAAPTTGSSFEEALDPANLRSIQGINTQHLQAEYERIPSDVGYYCGLAADAYVLHARAEAVLKDAEYDLDLEYRARGPAVTGSRVTDSWVEASVKTDPRYRRARDEAIAATEIKMRVQGVLKALDAKRDMLISLGADIRGERLPAPTIRERR